MSKLEILENDLGPTFDANSQEFHPSQSPFHQRCKFTELPNISAQARYEQQEIVSSSSSSKDSSEIENLLDFEIWPSEITQGFEHLESSETLGSLGTGFGNLPINYSTGFSSNLFTDSIEVPECESEDQVGSKIKFYLQWIDALVVLKGGKISERDLYLEMEKSNSTLYATIKKEFGGVLQLLMEHSTNFRVVNDAPFKWSIISLTKSSVGSEPLDHSVAKTYTTVISKPLHHCCDDVSVNKVIQTAEEILLDTESHELKAVELANTLRACVGTEALSEVKEHFGGLLVLLQKYPQKFTVRRIPKNDMVCLADVSGLSPNFSHARGRHSPPDRIAFPRCPIISRLTSEKWVPGKTWPANVEHDEPFIRAITEQLLKNAGPVTVSKLRGLVRIQLNSKDTIKSVPLKALIHAYSNVFSLSGNKVSLK